MLSVFWQPAERLAAFQSVAVPACNPTLPKARNEKITGLIESSGLSAHRNQLAVRLRKHRLDECRWAPANPLHSVLVGAEGHVGRSARAQARRGHGVIKGSIIRIAASRDVITGIK